MDNDNKILNDVDLEDIAQSPYTVTWATPSYDDHTRVITSVLTVSEEPGSAFDASADFKVEKRSGSPGSYTWTEDTNWTTGELPRFGDFTETALFADTAYDQTIAVFGTPTPIVLPLVTSGSLPPSMTLTSTRLHGTPSISDDLGTEFTVRFIATNSVGFVTKQVTFTLARNRLPVFDAFSTNNRILTENSAYDQTVTATGSPTPTITSAIVSGSVPTGMTLTGGRLYGTPTSIPDAGSSFSVDFTATSGTNTATMRIAFYVNNAAPSVPTNRYTRPAFNTFTQTSLREGDAYNQTITATGNPTPRITSRASSQTVIRPIIAYPSDRPVTAEHLAKVRSDIEWARTNFATQMNADGYGMETFTVPRDASNNIIVETFELPNTYQQYADNARVSFGQLPADRRGGNGNRIGHDIANIVDSNGQRVVYTVPLSRRRYPDDQIVVFSHRAGGSLEPAGYAWAIDNYCVCWLSGSRTTVGHEIGHLLGLGHVTGHYLMHPTDISAIDLPPIQSAYLNNENKFFEGVGTLPSGLTLSGGTLSGTPAVGTAGTFYVTFSAESSFPTVTKTIEFTIGR